MSDVRSWYLGLPNDKKQVFLAIVAHQLTVHGRYVGYEWSGEQQIKAFEGLNELQHQISSHIAWRAIGTRMKFSGTFFKRKPSSIRFRRS